MNKICNECNLEKPIEMFGVNKSCKDGYNNKCKECKNKLAAISRDKNREKINEKYREKYANNPEFKKHRKEIQKNSYEKKKENEPLYYAYMGAKSRAKSNNLDFNIDLDDLILPKICPLLEIPFVLNTGRDNHPGTPSIDRIVPELGYIKGNVKVISYKANTMKNNFNYMNNKDIVRTIENNESIELEDKELLG